MNLLCLYFGNSNRILSFINYLKTTYPHATIQPYNIFNDSDFERLQSHVNDSYDGIFLLSYGSDKTASEGFSSKQSKYNSKCSVSCLKQKYPERFKTIIDIIYKNMLTPILGVCYGAEILNLFYGGDIHNTGVRNQALFKTRLDISNKLFHGLERIIYPQYNHFYISRNNVSKPIAFNLSDFSQSAYQHSKYHYGVSFHLVNSDSQCLKIIDNFIDIIEYKKKAIYLYILLILVAATLVLKYFYNFKHGNLTLIILLLMVCLETLFH